MLMQTNSYVVPKEKRPEHTRLVARFRQTMMRLGCEHFEVYEQVGGNWSAAEASGRFVQIMRFRDRKHQQQVQTAERNDPAAQQLIREFCDLINLPHQQQQGMLAIGYYSSVVTAMPARKSRATADANGAASGVTETVVEGAVLEGEIEPASGAETATDHAPPLLEETSDTLDLEGLDNPDELLADVDHIEPEKR
jgi:hypothetical protein